MDKYLMLSIYLAVCMSSSGNERISRISIDTTEVQRVYVVPGKPLHIEFPCEVRFALPGTKSDLEIRAGIKEKNNLTFWAHSMSDVVGVTVKCGEKIVIFDVIPSRKKYQSYIKITGFSGSGSKKKLISSSMTNSEQTRPKYRRELLSSSDSSFSTKPPKSFKSQDESKKFKISPRSMEI